MKINDLITQDSREFPGPDPLVIPGYKPDSRRFGTGSIPVKSRTARKLISPTPKRFRITHDVGVAAPRKLLKRFGVPDGIRTRVIAVKGR